MRWRLWAYMAASASLFVIPACRRPVAQVSSVVTDNVLKAAGVNPLTLYYVAGLAVILVGVATFAFGGKATGAVLMACGAGIAYFGQTLILYPWLSLVAVVAAAVVAALIAYDRYKTRKATAVVVNAVEQAEHKAEVTAAIKGQGTAIANMVRRVVDPIKEASAKGGDQIKLISSSRLSRGTNRA